MKNLSTFDKKSVPFEAEARMYSGSLFGRRQGPRRRGGWFDIVHTSHSKFWNYRNPCCIPSSLLLNPALCLPQPTSPANLPWCPVHECLRDLFFLQPYLLRLLVSVSLPYSLLPSHLAPVLCGYLKIVCLQYLSFCILAPFCCSSCIHCSSANPCFLR